MLSLTNLLSAECWHSVNRCSVKLPAAFIRYADRAVATSQFWPNDIQFRSKLIRAIRGGLKILEYHAALLLMFLAGDQVKVEVWHVSTMRLWS